MESFPTVPEVKRGRDSEDKSQLLNVLQNFNEDLDNFGKGPSIRLDISYCI